MERFDIFVTIDNVVKYEETLYYDEDKDEILHKKEDVILHPGEKQYLKMLSNYK